MNGIVLWQFLQPNNQFLIKSALDSIFTGMEQREENSLMTQISIGPFSHSKANICSLLMKSNTNSFQWDPKVVKKKNHQEKARFILKCDSILSWNKNQNHSSISQTHKDLNLFWPEIFDHRSDIESIDNTIR